MSFKPEAIRREEAAQATVNEFLDKPFEWGVRDCLHLAAFAVQQRGYPNPLREVRTYKTEGGAYRALKKAGFNRLEDAIDAQGFARVEPKYARPGDLVAIQSDDAMGHALGVALSGNRFLAFTKEFCGFLKGYDHVLFGWRVESAVVGGR